MVTAKRLRRGFVEQRFGKDGVKNLVALVHGVSVSNVSNFSNWIPACIANARILSFG